MRILLLTHYFAPESGVPQRRWDALIREFVDAGHEVTVYCPPPHYPSGRIPAKYRNLRPGSVSVGDHGAVVRRVAWLPHRGDIVTRTIDHVVASMDTYRRAARRIRRGELQPDVIIATAPAIPTLIAARLLSRRHGIPVVTEMRDAWPDLVTHVPGMVEGKGVVGVLKRAIHDRVTALQRSSESVVTTTETFAEVLHRRGIDRVDVVRNGTRPEVFEQVPARVDDHDELRVLYMGNLGRSQGLELVVRAAAALRGEGVPISARLVGAGHARASLVKLNEELGRPVDIQLSVEPHEVVDHYAWADSTIVSLRDWEPFAWTIPSKLYELLSSGRHITGILAGESAEILREAEAGDIVAPGDLEGLIGLWRTLAVDRSRLAVSEKGRAWAREHVAFDRLAAHYLEILDGSVSPRRARSAT